MATYYELLGVEQGATGEEIQRAYRVLARRHHPDVAPDTDRSVMAAINGAWMVLSDPTRRRTYDASLSGPAAPPRPEPAGPGPQPVWQPIEHDDDELRPEDLSDDPYAAVERRPSDMLVMTPVLLLLAAVTTFFLSVISGSNGLRMFSILLVPLSGVGFVMAPLFVMLRSKSGPVGSAGGGTPVGSAE